MKYDVRLTMKWGVILGVAILVWTACIHVMGVYTTRIQYANFVDQLAVVIPIGVTALALLEQRRLNGGKLGFWQGVITGVGLSAISSPIAVGGLWVYHHFVNPQWLDILVAYERVHLKESGLSADAVAARISQLQQGGQDRKQLVGGVIGTIVFGLVVSVVESGILSLLGRRNRSA